MLASALPRLRCESADHSEIDDSNPTMLRNDPIDRIEKAEPTEPIEANEPTLPIERNEPVLPMDSIEFFDPMLR